MGCLISSMLLCKGVKIPEDRRCQFLWKMERFAHADHAAVPGQCQGWLPLAAVLRNEEAPHRERM